MKAPVDLSSLIAKKEAGLFKPKNFASFLLSGQFQALKMSEE